MDNVINGIKVPFIPIVQPDDLPVNKKVVGQDGFDIIFQRELDKIKFSNHATKRLEARNIELTNDALDKLQTAFEKAEAKGSRDSLVLINDNAFIVNIPNRTVVTAMPVSDNMENIFTNIDSVVFL